MMTRALVFFVVLVLVGLFAVINWDVFSALTPISLGFTTVQAPLGLILLGTIVFLCVLFTVWVIVLQAGSLRDARRQTKELQAQRDLADKAEASRFVELRSYLTSELVRVAKSSIDTRAEVLARIDRLQNEYALRLEQSTNTLAAHIGELEDRVERGDLPPPELTARGDHTPPLRR
jgi:uncharacterized integral membrane protein